MRTLAQENRLLREVAVAAIALVTSPWPSGSVEREPCERTLREKVATWLGGPVEKARIPLPPPEPSEGRKEG